MMDGSTELQDGIAFLDGLISLYPDTTSLLNKRQLQSLEINPNEPFADDNVTTIYLNI